MLQNKNIILNKIINAIKEEQQYIKKANDIDKKHYNMKINIGKIIELTELLKQQDITEENVNGNILITHNGNPYITYILAIKSICNNVNLDICINDVMLATNAIIIKIINEVLKELRINTKIQILRKLEIDEIKNKKDIKIIVLQDKSEYSKLLKNNIKNIYYKPKYNISLYSNNEELEELKHDIIKYCFENFIEIEIYEDENIQNVLEQIVIDNEGEDVILLTKEKINLSEIQKMGNEKNIKININKNILKDLEKRLINEQIL